MGLLDILSQYAAGAAQPQADTADHFDQAVNQSLPGDLGNAISSMLRSSATPPFGQLVGQMFNQSNPQQQAGVLNQIIQSLGPSVGGVAGGLLTSILGSAAASGGVTPAQASQVSADDAAALAAHAEQHNPSVVDEVGAFYSQHPTLVKSLGAAAMAVALGHLRR